MLDAQNLFDDSTSYAGEWQVDEAIGKLSDDQQPIVFAVDHGNEKRIDELTPFSNEKYGGGKAEEFMNWMLQQALPTVMNKYNIANTERKAIVGSSLGGLFSHYVAINFPDEFETVGVMSPSYWYSDSIYDATTKRKIVQKQRFWISGGTAEDESLISKIDQMQSLLELQGNTTVKVVILENAQHNEAQWRELFPQFLNWWFRLED
jgi:predicted alpha/beta superfamily hydrolase